MFQFHSGSIKRRLLIVHGCLLGLSFNSIVVRLKVSKNHDHYDAGLGFNSIVVRLKVLHVFFV